MVEEVPDVVDSAVARRDAFVEAAQTELHWVAPGQRAFGPAVPVGDVGGLEGAFGFFEGLFPDAAAAWILDASDVAGGQIDVYRGIYPDWFRDMSHRGFDQLLEFLLREYVDRASRHVLADRERLVWIVHYADFPEILVRVERDDVFILFSHFVFPPI